MSEKTDPRPINSRPEITIDLAGLDEPPPGVTHVVVNGYLTVPADDIRAARRARQAASHKPPLDTGNRSTLPSTPPEIVAPEPSSTARDGEKPAHSGMNDEMAPPGKGKGSDRPEAFEEPTGVDVKREIGMIAMAKIPEGKRNASLIKAKVRCLELLADHHGLVGAQAARLPADRKTAIDLVARELQARGVKVVDRSIETPAKLLEPPPVVVEAENGALQDIVNLETEPKSLTSNEEAKTGGLP